MQSRCPTRLIDDGRTSRMAVEDSGGLGWGVAVGGAVGAGVAVLAGAAAVAVGGAPVRAASEVVPQAARALTSMSAPSNTTALRTANRRKGTSHITDLLTGTGARRVTKAFVGVLRGGCPVRANSGRCSCTLDRRSSWWIDCWAAIERVCPLVDGGRHVRLSAITQRQFLVGDGGLFRQPPALRCPARSSLHPPER